MNDVQDFFTKSKIDGWDVILAVLVVIVSIGAARAARGATVRLFNRVKGVPPESARIVSNVVKYFVLLVGVGVALNFVGATVQPLTTAAIVAAVVAVLVLRGVAANFGAGLVLQTKGPFKPGDEVELMGHIGTVRELNGRAVVIETEDGDTIYFANGEVVASPIVNRSARGVRRSELEVSTSLARPYEEIRTTIETATRDAEGVHPDPPPETVTFKTEPDRATLRLYFSHDSTASRTVGGNVIDAVTTALRTVNVDATVGRPPPVCLSKDDADPPT
jgi:small-conductance mechanosensitive channel